MEGESVGQLEEVRFHRRFKMSNLTFLFGRIGHDNAGGGAAWHLNNVVIDCPSLGATWVFPCNRWLSEKDDDGKIERELFPQELETAQYKPCEWTKSLKQE